MTQKKPFIYIRHAQKSYGTLEVLKDISLSVQQGEIVAIIGPSGAGESTLLRAINDLDPLTGGEVWLEDMQINKSLPHRQYEKHINFVRQQIGMVFQHFNLFPHLTVRENITLAPKMLRNLSDDDANTLRTRPPWSMVRAPRRSTISTSALNWKACGASHRPPQCS